MQYFYFFYIIEIIRSLYSIHGIHQTIKENKPYWSSDWSVYNSYILLYYLRWVKHVSKQKLHLHLLLNLFLSRVRNNVFAFWSVSVENWCTDTIQNNSNTRPNITLKYPTYIYLETVTAKGELGWCCIKLYERKIFHLSRLFSKLISFWMKKKCIFVYMTYTFFL